MRVLTVFSGVLSLSELVGEPVGNMQVQMIGVVAPVALMDLRVNGVPGGQVSTPFTLQ